MSFEQPLATLIFTLAAGVLSLLLGAKIKVPSILFLLLFGVLLGPSFADLVQPKIFRMNFPHYIELMVALILFEGGSTLKFGQYKAISRSVRNLLTIGAAVTLVGVSLAAHYWAGLDWSKAILFGAIMVVTGPTVVTPILKRLHVQEKVHNILKWESILIDPLGVILAVVLFEFLVLQHGSLWNSLLLLAGRFVSGGALGLATGWVMAFCLTKRWLLRQQAEELGGLFVLFMTALSFGVSEFLLPHSGLVTVTVAGIYFGNRKLPFEKEIERFKDQIVMLALSILFILLASNIPVKAAMSIQREGLIMIAVMVLVIRPLGVYLSTWSDKSLSFREKSFLALMAPRGIVSASLASLFAIAFEERALSGSGIFLPLAFYVIAGMILFYALLAEVIARLTGVKEGVLRGVVIVGANPLGLLIGAELAKSKIPVRFIDSNPPACDRAREKGFQVYHGSAFDAEFIEAMDIKGVGAMIAVTPNHEVNVLSCQIFSRFVPRKRIFRLWGSSDRWDAVVSPHFDATMGNPVVSLEERSLQDLTRSAAFAGSEVRRRKLAKDLKVTPESLKLEGIGNPLFAVKNDQADFFTAGHVIPKDSEVAYLPVT